LEVRDVVSNPFFLNAMPDALILSGEEKQKE